MLKIKRSMIYYCCSRRRRGGPRRSPRHLNMWRLPKTFRPIRHRPLHPAQSGLLQQGELRRRPLLQRVGEGQGQRRRRPAAVDDQHQETEHIRPDIRKEGFRKRDAGPYSAPRLPQVACPGRFMRRRRRFFNPEEKSVVFTPDLVQPRRWRRHQTGHQAGTDGYQLITGRKQPVEEVEDGSCRRGVEHDTQR